MSNPVRATLKSRTSSVRSLHTMTWASIGAEEAFPIVTRVSRELGPEARIVRSGLNVAWKYGMSNVAAGRWSMVQVMAPALVARANRATTAKHATKVFFIEISSLLSCCDKNARLRIPPLALSHHLPY